MNDFLVYSLITSIIMIYIFVVIGVFKLYFYICERFELPNLVFDLSEWIARTVKNFKSKNVPKDARCNNCKSKSYDDWHEIRCHNKRSKYYKCMMDDYSSCEKWKGRRGD